MNQETMKQLFREGTATPAPGSRERVWQALKAPAPTRRPLLLIPLFVAATAAGVALTLSVIRPPAAPPLRWSDPHSVVLSTSARATFDAPSRRVQLEAGEVALSSWGAPLELLAAGHTVRVEAGVVVVLVAGESVTVSPVEGVASFDGTALRPNPASRIAAGLLGQRAAAMESPVAQARHLLSRADDLVAERKFDGAVENLGAVARLGGLDAEVALYKKGELELRELSRPEVALATFDDGEARFAQGALAQERQLSAIEACVALERWQEVVDRTARFLQDHPGSERADELSALLTAARQRIP